MLTIAADEHASLQLEDLASALDAGLPIAALAGDGDSGDRSLHAALARRRVKLTATEDKVLLAAWRAGRAGVSLRSCAKSRQRRADFQRALWAGLRYPLLLLLLTFVAALTTAPVVGHYGFAAAIAVLAGLAVGLVLAARRSLRRGGRAITRVPGLGRLLSQLAELPYLEILQALYGAGVPLAQANTDATTAVTLAPVRERLQVANQIVQSGRSLGEALNEALALHPETRTLLANGERAGQLEDALGRALERRREMTARDITTAARRTGNVVYAASVAFIVVVVYSFYSGYFGRLQGALRR